MEIVSISGEQTLCWIRAFLKYEISFEILIVVSSTVGTFPSQGVIAGESTQSAPQQLDILRSDEH